MEIIEKIKLTFDDLDEEKLGSISRACVEMVTPFRLNLIFCRTDQSKLEIIQSKQKEAQEKIKEMSIKALYAVDLYYQHLNIEQKKESKGQPFSIPLIPDGTSILKVKLIQSTDYEDKLNEVDHVACALINAQKICEESILWTIFYSELEDLEDDIQEGMEVDRKYELPESTIQETSFAREPFEEESLEKENSKYTQDWQRIFKDMKAYKIFEYLQDNLVTEKNQSADYTFIFRQMQRDEYIYDDIKEKSFRDYLSRNFEIELDYKLKPEGYNITESKEKIYSNAIRSSHTK